MKKIYTRIKRCDHPEKRNYFQEFEVSLEEGSSVIDLLLEIEKNPITFKRDHVSPIRFLSSCHQGKCGSCAMIINGKPSMACSTKIDDLPTPIIIEPLKNFPVLRDLIVDRSKLKKIDRHLETYPDKINFHHELFSKNQSHEMQNCFQCGICLEVCPQTSKNPKFIGAYGISKSHQFLNLKKKPNSIFEGLMNEGGINDCGQAQTCEKYCPQEISLIKFIAKTNRAVLKESLKRLLDT